MKDVFVVLWVAGSIGAAGGCVVEDSGQRGEALPGDPCLDTFECVPGSICFNEFCVGTGELRISLSFEVDTDLDLHLLTPSGSEIYFGNRSADGGTLDVDQCISGCGNDTHVENVVFSAAPAGGYLVWVENFDGRDAGAFTVEVDVAGGDLLVFEGALPAVADTASEEFAFAL